MGEHLSAIIASIPDKLWSHPDYVKYTNMAHYKTAHWAHQSKLMLEKRLWLTLIQNVRMCQLYLPHPFISWDPHNCLTIGTVSAWIELKPLLTFKLRSLESIFHGITPCNKFWSGSSEQSSSATLILYLCCTNILSSGLKTSYHFPRIFSLLFLGLLHAFHYLQPFAAQSHISTKFVKHIK